MNPMELKKQIEKCKKRFPGNRLKSRICVVNYELQEGTKLMEKYPKSITIFGSARLPQNHYYSKKASELGEKLSKLGYAIVTGGGHGIMEAAHHGAHLANGNAIGINIELPHEQTINKYVTESLEFHHFFSRKVILSYSAEAYIYFPGGFGTLDEFFEILTLQQTGKIPSTIPLFLFGSEYWGKLYSFFEHTLIPLGTISPEDLNLFTITDSVDEIVEKLKTLKPRTDE